MTGYKQLYITTALILVLALWSGTALAQIELRWSPSDTTVVEPGGTARLSLYIDDAINLRTVEVTATYDTTVVKSLGGGPGLLYSNSGYFVFQGFEEEPGRWHGYAIVMGAGEYISGPGELLYWDIEGLAPGISPVLSVEAILYDEASPPNLIPNVSLRGGTIIVGDPLSAAFDLPAARSLLEVAPNPFNPRTQISFSVAQDTPALLSVFDARGRKVAVLHDGLAGAGTLAVDWNGTNDTGQNQPTGVYFFVLETDRGRAWAKGILVK